MTNQPTAAQPIDRSTIRDVFIAHGFTIKPGQDDLKPYVYEAALALIALARQQPAASGAGEVAASDDDVAQRLRAQAVTPFGPEGFVLLTEAADRIAELRAQLARQHQEVPHAPAGWQMVPVHPTPKMIDATFNHRPLAGESHNRRNNRIYGAMLAAAPAAPHALADGKWVPCTPNLLNAGVSCANTPRRPGNGYSHDHFISHAAPAAPHAQAEPVAVELSGCLESRLYEAISIARDRAQHAGSTQRMKKWTDTAADLRAALTARAPAQEAEQAAPAAVTDHLHNTIMRLPCNPPEKWSPIQQTGYKIGHRDARHAVAELACAAPAVTDAEGCNKACSKCCVEPMPLLNNGTREQQLESLAHAGVVDLLRLHDALGFNCDEVVDADKMIARIATLAPAGTEPTQAARDVLADAKRLDWIEQQIREKGSIWILPCGPDMRFAQVRSAGHTDNYPSVEGTAREAIDAALRTQSKE